MPLLPAVIGYLNLNVRLLALLLLDLEQQRAVDVRQDTSERDGRTDQGVKFLITTDGELQMARGDALHLEVLGGVAGKLEDFGGEVFEDGRHVYGGLGADTHLVLGLRLEETLDTAAWKLSSRVSV